MSGTLWALLGIAGGFGLAAIGDMVSEEVRDRLDHLPHAILRLAARRLDPAQRAIVYDDEWMPELTYILKGDEARPVTRLYHGARFASGILSASRRIGRTLERADATYALAGQLITEGISGLGVIRDQLELVTRQVREAETALAGDTSITEAGRATLSEALLAFRQQVNEAQRVARDAIALLLWEGEQQADGTGLPLAKAWDLKDELCAIANRHARRAAAPRIT